MQVGHVWIVIGVLSAGLSGFSFWYGPHLLAKNIPPHQKEASQSNVFANNQVQTGRDFNLNQMVVNVNQKQQRHLTPDVAKQLVNGLSADTKDIVVLKYTSNDTESYQYAKEFKKFLESQNWKVEGPHPAMFFNKKPRKGVNVASPKNGKIDISVYGQ